MADLKDSIHSAIGAAAKALEYERRNAENLACVFPPLLREPQQRYVKSHRNWAGRGHGWRTRQSWHKLLDG